MAVSLSNAYSTPYVWQLAAGCIPEDQSRNRIFNCTWEWFSCVPVDEQDERPCPYFVPARTHAQAASSRILLLVLKRLLRYKYICCTPVHCRSVFFSTFSFRTPGPINYSSTHIHVQYCTYFVCCMNTCGFAYYFTSAPADTPCAQRVTAATKRQERGWEKTTSDGDEACSSSASAPGSTLSPRKGGLSASERRPRRPRMSRTKSFASAAASAAAARAGGAGGDSSERYRRRCRLTVVATVAEERAAAGRWNTYMGAKKARESTTGVSAISYLYYICMICTHTHIYCSTGPHYCQCLSP